ncbi:MAG: TonB-dependent receptor [Bacteroidota bacterium]|nr:TonB-dependent receptor [Bacteroidota bacterium]
MKFSLSFIFFFLTCSCTIWGQLYTISGSVKDISNNEHLVGVSVYHKTLGKGAVTDLQGFYSIQLPAGPQSLSFRFIGFKEKTIDLLVSANHYLNISIEPDIIQTGEVVVAGRRENENIVKTVDNLQVSKEEIARLPHLFGEVDPIKILQLLPGVQSNGEGNNGIFVRGGGVDQNLILLDQAMVYNTGHLFGFFSLFNYSILDNVNLIKGGIPTYYGGRLSSVLEVNTKSGDFERFKGEGSLGIVSGNLALEGPISKGKSSFIVSGRRTYIDFISKLVTNDPTIFNSGINYYFDDFNARIDIKASPKNKIAWSAFMGSDNFQFVGKNSLSNNIEWKNYTTSIFWDHFLNDSDYITTTAFGSSYRLDFSAGINEYIFNINSSIEDYGLKNVWSINSLKNHKISFGAEYIHHALVPNNVKAQGLDFEIDLSKQEKLNSREFALFANDAYQVSTELSLSGGLRLNGFQQLGPFTSYITDASLNLIDTALYKKRETIKTYINLDPRISLNYKLNERTSLKASFDRMHQYLHMAPVSSVSLPTDVWVPSSDKIKPQKGSQYSLGLYRNFNENDFETSITTYYKSMKNQLEYRDGVIVGYSKGYNYDDNFIFGNGKSYGVETFIKKNKGRLTGWLSYTLSRTTRNFEEINQGTTFAAKYDRLHNLSVVGGYSLSERWALSTIFTYATGNAITLPVGRYIIGGNIINEYEGRNTFRMPSYHRMDISATYKASNKTKYESFWVFSLYNLYNRKNPYYIYFETEGNVNDYYLKVSLEKVSLFPIIPSIAYQIKF